MNNGLNNGQADHETIRFSKIWVLIMALVAIYGFGLLMTFTIKAYHDKPPIPELVINEQGDTLFTGNDIREGQSVFLKYGLMDNGTVWGHGAYLGPDFPALYLHRLALRTADIISLDFYDTGYENLSVEEQSQVASLIKFFLKENRYIKDDNILVFSPFEEYSLIEEQPLWLEYFRSPENNGGLRANLITDPDELFKLTSYFAWTAWASIADRPNASYSYTNNFPYDELAGNTPTPGSVVWSVVSILFLLGGIGALLFVFGRNKTWGWAESNYREPDYARTGNASLSQKALMLFVCTVGLLFLGQTLVGGGVAHYRADPGNFYGIDLSKIFPSALLRTWHLQLAIFWIATGFAGGGLYLARVLGGKEMRGQAAWTYILFAAFGIVIFGSLLCEWAGLSGWFENTTFWFGSQGWEYLELGRLWQYLLIAGLIVWFILVARASAPAFERRSTRTLTTFFWIAALAIPVFYVPAIFFDNMTHYTIVDTWRFWIIHLWVEGFFELFATVMVALIFIELGIVAKKTGLLIIFLDVILIFMGGIVGTGHHWYFSGQTQFNMAVSGCFSALEVVPLVLLTLEGWSFMKLAKPASENHPGFRHKWTLIFLMGVGFWNFLGAGVFGFLINMPIVSYFEIGTYLTPNHGHAAMFGVFGMLSLSLCVFIMREICDDRQWLKVEKGIKLSFWGLNIGLMMMIVMSLLPSGLVQIWDSVENGYWHARSLEFTGSPAMRILGWLRMPGDLIFIFLGALPFFIASLKVLFRKK